MRPRPRPFAHAAGALAILAAALVVATAAAAPTPDQLQRRIDRAQSREQALKSAIHTDTVRIQGFAGPLADLRARLAAVQASLDIERAQLGRIQTQLRDARARLAVLQAQLARDHRVLAQQLVAEYESPPPDIVNVLIDARGFADLIERVDALKRVERQNVATTLRVKAERRAVASQTTRLARAEARQQRITGAVLVQRDQVAQLKDAILARELAVVRRRAGKGARLASLRQTRRTLERRLAAEIAPSSSGGTAGPFASSGTGAGFFPAPGTNYSAGDEPKLAERLNVMAKALGLHLIGISGYRTPQHSVEVGGFANDPHTRGQASDTPGVEGVSEATLERFGLTRPFGGAAEADHIQLLGSI